MADTGNVEAAAPTVNCTIPEMLHLADMAILLEETLGDP
jgi:hypothetical protein